MVQPIALTSIRRSPSHPATRRERPAHPSWRQEAFRLGAIAALSLTLAAVILGVSYVAGRHLVAAWWLERLRGNVVWEIDQSNWRHGGTTTVSLGAGRSWDPKLGNSDLAHLSKLHHVVSLNLSENDRLTSKGLAALRGLEFLTELNLERMHRYREPRSGRISVPLSDACLVHLMALPRLEVLALSGNLITDQGLAQLARMSTLKTLDLEATEITDAGLASIEGMKNLEEVNLGATRVTRQAVMRLQTVRPDLLINLDSDPVVENSVRLSRGTIQ